MESLSGTIALVVRLEGRHPVLIESLSDEGEIEVLQRALREGKGASPLEQVRRHREERIEKDEEFSDYVEDLVTQPFVRPEVQEHGVRWLRSKLRIEQFQRCEREATEVIARYALKIFEETPSKTDFFLAGPTAQVRIRIFPIQQLPAKAA